MCYRLHRPIGQRLGRLDKQRIAGRLDLLQIGKYYELFRTDSKSHEGTFSELFGKIVGDGTEDAFTLRQRRAYARL